MLRCTSASLIASPSRRCCCSGPAILYIPANVLPVMNTRTFFDDERDTIMSGVVVLMQSGSWPIALLVFIASIVVPLVKIIALAVLLYSAWRGSRRHRPHRSELFRLVEFVGRWSMLDIYAISLLATLVQVQSFASIIVGWGSLGIRRRRGPDHARHPDLRRAALVGRAAT